MHLLKVFESSIIFSVSKCDKFNSFIETQLLKTKFKFLLKKIIDLILFLINYYSDRI